MDKLDKANKRERSRSQEKSPTAKDVELKKRKEKRKPFGITENEEEETKISSPSDRSLSNDSRGHNNRYERHHDSYDRNSSRYDRNKGHRGDDIKYYEIYEDEEQELEKLKLDEVLIKEFREDPQATEDYNFNLEFDTKLPAANPLLGDLDELNDLKRKITPVVKEWDERVKFLISDYELINISRPRNIADERYNCPIIRYHNKTTTRACEDLATDRDALYPVYSRAYFKLFEVLSETKMLDEFKDEKLCIANVAEGSGGFIQALLDFRKRQKNNMSWKEDSYTAITLKVGENKTAVSALDWDYSKAQLYFNMLRDNGYDVNLSYGIGDGDLYKMSNIEYFAEEDLDRKKCQLVTADGGVGLQEYEEFCAQEPANAKLFFAEIITTFSVQEKGGSFVLKIYDFFSTIGLQLLAILRTHYERVRIIKPLTSRPANSEKYLICEGFKGITSEKLNELKETLIKWGQSQGNSEYSKSNLFLTNLTDYHLTPKSILVQDLREFNDLVNSSQKMAIEKGLEIIAKKQLNNRDLIRECKLRQKRLAELWCEKHGLPYIKNLKLSKLKSI